MRRMKADYTVTVMGDHGLGTQEWRYTFRYKKVDRYEAIARGESAAEHLKIEHDFKNTWIADVKEERA